MTTLRCFTLVFLLGSGIALPAAVQDKKPMLDEKLFNRIGTMFLENPAGDSAHEQMKAIFMFTIQTPKAAVVVGSDELKWFGNDDKRTPLLLAAFFVGNVQSQLHSGVKRNDRYSGLLSLFQVYRVLQDKDKNFKVPAVEELWQLHKDEKLLKHIVDLEQRVPTKLTPADEEALKKIFESGK